MNLHDRFEQYEDEFLKFDRIDNPKSKRPDLHAFLMLDEIQPGERDLISASEHDEFYLDIDCDAFAEKATDEQIRDLQRCGIRYDSELDSLCMFA
ncbi:hypothetical protein [Variovorax sp. PAMC 28711]|uniref:hypothetical protein n=1 Tax=Variovorax sp. PAMC 28711 TaxID=1795631 RepID=UPI00078E1BB5|nr:hypothetical protein [Variovorax sp. PAMC 28711]AMM23150.1 hypothetical protein AX767_01265 [Variovorax sp. PAMC 28711]